MLPLKQGECDDQSLVGRSHQSPSCILPKKAPMKSLKPEKKVALISISVPKGGLSSSRFKPHNNQMTY